MAEKALSESTGIRKKPSKKPKTKVEKLEQIYGKGKSTASLEDASAYLKRVGYDSLADLLVPAK